MIFQFLCFIGYMKHSLIKLSGTGGPPPDACVCLQGMYVFMHAVKGTPFETPDQGKARLLTHWEQLDYGVQFTSSRKFFTISPIILYVCFTV